MTRCRFVFALTLTLFSLACTHTQEVDLPAVSEANDAMYRQKVVGTWKSDYTLTEFDMRIEANTTYREDESIESNAIMTIAGEQTPVTFKGTYRITEGKKCFTILEETGGILTEEIGKENCERILRANGEVIEVVDLHNGRVTVETRVVP